MKRHGDGYGKVIWKKTKQTGDLIFEAQEQALRTNWIREHNDGQEVSEKYRMCGERNESITHLIAECKELAQKEYKQRHDNIARIVHLELCQKFGLVGEFKWYNHKSGEWQGQNIVGF